jgi:hypothetical protein
MWSKSGPGTCSAAAERPRRSSAASKPKGDAAPRWPPVLSPAPTGLKAWLSSDDYGKLRMVQKKSAPRDTDFASLPDFEEDE